MSIQPVVVVLIGLPGSGKTTIAKALERELDMHRVCRDTIRAALFPRCSFSPAEKRAANHASMRALEVNCAIERHSVMDGRTFSKMRERLEVEERIQQWGARAIAVWVNCPLAIARARVAADAEHTARDRNEDMVSMIASRFEAPAAGCLVVDASLPRDEMTADAVRAIRDAMVFG